MIAPRYLLRSSVRQVTRRTLALSPPRFVLDKRRQMSSAVFPRETGSGKSRTYRWLPGMSFATSCTETEFTAAAEILGVNMRILTVVACLVGTLFVTSTAQAGNRVAFVVGNGAYKFVQPLPNPTVDAKSMATLLRNAGFEVVEGTDLGREGMTSRLREFATKSQGADVAVFYYAGHGISVNGKNYLIPVDADLKSEMDVMFGAAIDVDVTLDQTMADLKVKVVLLDACRDNPFAAKIRSAARTRAVTVNSGLAEMKSAKAR